MVQTFEQYLGAITINRKPVDKLNEPDVKVPIPNIIQSGRSSAVPHHWSNSPYLSGGRYGSGSNPKSKKKKKMGYIDSYKKYSKKLEEDQMAMGQNPAGGVPKEFQAESDSLTQEEANLLKQLASVKERRIALDKKIADAKNQQAQQAADLAQQQANQAANQA